MKYGVRLHDDPRDLAALRTLADTLPALRAAPWIELRPTDPSARGAVLHAAFDVAQAQQLRARGVEVVRFAEDDHGALVAQPYRPNPVDPATRWEGFVTRPAPTLWEAVRPRRVPGDPLAEEACFWVAREGDGAHRTIERLLALGRDDATVVSLRDGAADALLIRVSAAPLYLLMRARDEPAEGVRAYVREGDGGLWVAFGYAHPLGSMATRALREQDRRAFVDADGHWRFVDPDAPARSIYDVLETRFEARAAEWTAAPGTERFRITLRLAPAPPADPELWLLDPEQFLAMEPLVESLPDEELARFTISRNMSPGGTRYVLQELVRPNVPRLGVRVTDTLGAPGYARAPGVDNLYLPVGRRLVPTMRRDELRALLGTDRARAVIVTEDGDGPCLVSVVNPEESSLRSWVEYAASDRRVELERLAERSVFDWPELAVERPPTADEPRRRDEDDESRRPPRSRRREAPAEAREQPRTLAGEESAVTAALREAMRAVEGRLAEGGCEDPSPWRELALLKQQAGDVDDACACLEAAIFHGALEVDLAARLASQRARVGGRSGSAEELVTLATAERLAPGEAAYLGARALEHVARGDAMEVTLAEGVFQEVARRFASPETPASRRLAWSVLRAVHGRAGDALELTRAKERLLGGVNDRGLSESIDLPRFVRYALALTVEGAEGEMARSRAEQLRAMEDLWRDASEEPLPELDPRSAYVRMAFGVGFTRIGGPVVARDIVAPVEAELPVHEPANRVIFQLYLARLAHEAPRGDAGAWLREVETTLATVKDARVKDRVEFLRKRSEWLRSAAPTSAASSLRPVTERGVAEAEGFASGALIAERMRELLDQRVDQRELFDYEIEQVIERLLRAALRSGSDEGIAVVLAAAMPTVATRVRSPGRRVAATGECIKAAAALGDLDAVDRLLESVASMAGDVQTPNELLTGVHPSLAALRRLGAGASARRFLEALEPVAAKAVPGSLQVRASLAEGYLLLRDDARATAMMESTVDDVLSASLGHVERYDAGAAALAALRHWPMEPRLAQVRRLLRGLDRFTDAYTASAQRLYETFKVLTLERIVDTVADDVTFESDKVRGYLDEDEQAIRRRVLADWRAACGR
jgi:cellulose synthase operon protein C